MIFSISPSNTAVENPPQVWGAVRRRMRPAIHVDRVVDRPQPRRVIRRDLPRDRIDFLPDADLRRSARDVHRAVRPALPLRQRVEGGVPGLRAQAAGRGSSGCRRTRRRRDSRCCPRPAPSSTRRKIHLRVGRDADQGRRQQRARACHRGSPEVAHLGLLGMWPGSIEPGRLDPALSLQPKTRRPVVAR